MMVFVIPLKSKTITSDWASFSSLLNRCINSICSQTNTNFKVIVACHEIPATKFNDDSRVEFLKVAFSPPILKKNPDDLWLKRADKGKKIKFAVDYGIRIGASYVMTVDSDDCVSNKICEFVCKNGNDSISGWYVEKGYLYPEGKSYLYLNLKNFHTLCGTCVIIKPELIDLMYGKNFWFDHERTNLEKDLSLLPLPFPAAIYSMLNG
jgi:NAD-dependent dihydropyrimidine dehydrogenase PreA subunit